MNFERILHMCESVKIYYNINCIKIAFACITSPPCRGRAQGFVVVVVVVSFRDPYAEKSSLPASLTVQTVEQDFDVDVALSEHQPDKLVMNK